MITNLVNNQKDYFNKNETKDINFRINALKKLKDLINSYENEILDALYKDLRKSHFESYETEIGIVLEEIDYTIKRLKKWSKPKKVRTNLINFKSKSYIYNEPYGVVLIIAPWNYPFQLTLAPLIGSIAAGNCTVIKTSEYAPSTSAVLVELINNNFSNHFIKVVEGGRETNQQLLDEKFDYIFFTGSVPVGKIVMEKAAKNLIPVTLELGGKSPLIVNKDVDTKLAAKRIVWGKFLNAGQTCVAPDYMIVHKDVKNRLLKDIKKTIEEFYGQETIKSPDYPRIINQRHFDRLTNLMNDGNILIGGSINKDDLFIEPTLIDGVDLSSSIMEDEIFGPLLPILDFEYIDEIYDIVRHYQKPLALYVFTNDRKFEKDILENISFGGGCVNETVMHLTSPYLPFGGVGHSGMGSYHGKYSYDTFSHKKSILKKSNWFDLSFRYPPYNNRLKWLKKIMK